MEGWLTVRDVAEEFQSSLLRCSYCDGRRGSFQPPGLRFNPLYWGVLIVTSWFFEVEACKTLRFQSSLLRCSYCDSFNFWSSKRISWVSILFTEVFLLWHCLATREVIKKAVSILFTEVFLLWQRSETKDRERGRSFQSSLLRCSYCDYQSASRLPRWLPFQSSLLRCSYCDAQKDEFVTANAAGFNPLYWGVLIVTNDGDVPAFSLFLVSILFTEVFLLWRTTPDWFRVIFCSFNPLYWGVLIVTENFSTGLKRNQRFQSSLLRCSYCDGGRWIPWYD